MPAEETLTRCVVDTLARKFYLYSSEGSERVVNCETPDQFMNVLEVVRAQVSDDCLAYSDPLWQMEVFTVEEFQEQFDELLERVENGEHIGIVGEDGRAAVMVPADDEIIRIYTNHEEGCWFKATYETYKLLQGNFYASETW
jgi:antitoxin (DNA-binding transcriptional repressor) of toxin-antitoxin stability system